MVCHICSEVFKFLPCFSQTTCCHPILSDLFAIFYSKGFFRETNVLQFKWHAMNGQYSWPRKSDVFQSAGEREGRRRQEGEAVCTGESCRNE